MRYIFVEEATDNEVAFEAESHHDAIDMAYEALSEPVFLYVAKYLQMCGK